MNAETFNELMKQVARLTLHQRALLRKRLDALDGEQKALAVIESPSSDQPRSCPHCQGTALDRHGQVSGLQRYRCQTCHRTFNALTGTALARLRKKDKWLGFSAALVASQPLRPAAAALQVHRNTTLRWRHRFLGSVKADRTASLQGITQADETYFLASRKGCRKLERPAGGAAKRVNRVCLASKCAFWWRETAPSRPWTGSQDADR